MTSEASTAEIVPVEVGAIVAPAASLSTTVAAFNAYQQMQQRLLTDDDYQTIQGKKFPTKSAWRKLAVAFNVSTEIDDERIDYDDAGILRATYRVRAIAPNGRSEQGIGVCSRYDKCQRNCKTQDCDGLRHFSHPEPDIVATAHTRAKNRACADLFGFGQISAEEVGAGEDYGGFPTETTRRATIQRLRGRIERLGLAADVKALGYAWPWTVETCNLLDDLCDTAEYNQSAPADSPAVQPTSRTTDAEPPGAGGSPEPPSPRAGAIDPQAAIDQLAPAVSLDDARALAAERAAAEALMDSTAEQRQAIALACKDMGWSDDERRAFVTFITKGRAAGASQTNRGDAEQVRHAVGLVRAKSLEVTFWDRDEGGGTEAQVEPKNKAGRDWLLWRP